MSVRMILRALGVGDIITLSNITENDTSISPNNAQVGVRFETDGDITKQQDGGAFSTDLGDWIVPKINMADFSIRATVNSGSVSAGSDTTGSWLALTSDRTWTKSRTDDAAGSDVVNLTIEIARTSDTSLVLDSCTMELTAQVLAP
jgi:hypothetical protein